LGCLAAAVEEYPAHAIVRIGCGRPFIDSMLIGRLVIAAEADGGAQPRPRLVPSSVHPSPPSTG